MRALGDTSGLRVLEWTAAILAFHWGQGPCPRLLASHAGVS
ncbi:MAG: hypothetical protein ACK587_15455 [Cyanobacteriota bacterium]